MSLYPELNSCEEIATDTVVSIINKAKETLGIRQNLKQLSRSRKVLKGVEKVSLSPLKSPLAVTCRPFLQGLIEKSWCLTKKFSYLLNFLGECMTECSVCYYFEAIFSQPIARYPIPQGTASVYFRVEDKYTEQGVPQVVFRLEGTHSDHDVRYVLLDADWLFAILQMKMKVFRRIEEINLF